MRFHEILNGQFQLVDTLRKSLLGTHTRIHHTRAGQAQNQDKS
jgi:hypothetical protein